MKICSDETKILTFEGKDNVRVEIVVNNNAWRNVNLKFQNLCGIIWRTVVKKAQKENVLKCYDVMVKSFAYGSEYWSLIKQINEIDTSDVHFLRAVAGYHLTDKKPNEGIRR